MYPSDPTILGLHRWISSLVNSKKKKNIYIYILVVYGGNGNRYNKGMSENVFSRESKPGLLGRLPFERKIRLEWNARNGTGFSRCGVSPSPRLSRLEENNNKSK